VRDIPVIPICHSGLNPDTLPPPLSSLQGALATDKDQLERVLAVLAKELDCKLPNDIHCSEFIERVQRFESESQWIDQAQSGSLLANSGGLAPYEIATLVAVAECADSPDDIVWPHRITERMNKAGYRNVASVLGLAGLKRKGLIDTQMRSSGDWNNSEETNVVTINQFGWAWLESNAESIELRDESNEPYVASTASSPPSDDIPF